MNVIVLTIFIGLVLVTFFVLFFLHQSSRQTCNQRDALMPLGEEGHRAVTKATQPLKPTSKTP